MFSHPLRNRLGLLLGVIWFLGLSGTTLLAQDARGLLDKAAKQIDAGDYIAAKETLEQVKPAQLSPADQDRISYLRAKADRALENSAALRQSIVRADRLAKQNDFVKARQILEDALASAPRSPAEKSRIKAKLAEIEARRKQSAGQMKDLFYRSVEDYKAGRLDQADKGFKAVVESGVDLGFWNRGKPQKYLKKIAEKRAQLPKQPLLQPSPKKATIVIKPAPRDEELEPVMEVPPPTQLRPVVTAPEPAQARSRVTTPTAGQTLIGTEVRRRRIITGQITFQHKIAMDRAEDLIRQHKFAEARRVVREAQDALATNQSILPPAQMALMHTAGQTKLAYIGKEERTYQVAQTEDQRIRAQVVAQQALARADQQREERVKQLFSQGTTYLEERNYQQALDRYIQVLNIDPNNPDARKLAGWLQDQIWLLKTQDLEHSAETEYQKAIDNIRDASIPFDRDPPLTWDPNWEAISKRRLRGYTGIAQDTPENIEAHRMLDVRHPRFDYQETPLSEVFDDLRAKSGLNIVPNWQSLTTAGIEQDKPISLQLHNVSLERALKAILSTLSSAGYYGTTVSHVIEDGIIVIATSEDLAAELSIKVHEIADLLMETGERRGGPRFEAGGGESTTGGEDRGTGGGGGTRPGGGGGGGGGAGLAAADIEELRTDLIENILTYVRTIEPDSWQENGGPGTASIWGTKLLIYQTAEIHAKIRDMLELIRDTRPLQISVEPRFIYVTDNFLEDIGVDLDMTLAARGNFGDISAEQRSDTLTAPTETGMLGTFAGDVSAIALSGSYLDNLQVDFFIRATQASRQATTLMAPRVTFENAGSASIYVGREINYVEEVQIEVEVIATDPPTVMRTITIVIGQIPSGPTLNVGGVVSPDRRFVRLDIEIILYDLFDLPFLWELFTWPIPQNDPNWPVFLTQLPLIDTTTISTQVSVPDGGALLIGGLRRKSEEKKEAGVPILNKIPWIKRFFTNTSRVDDKSVLVILLRPRIIDLKEEQGLTHPALGER